MALPETIPLFPLPNVVLFPNVLMPLHIFEPRYRSMVSDALEGNRVIGMALLKPGYERDYEGRPPIYPIGCAGVITYSQKLADGRYEIVVRGLEKFRVASEDASRAYRVASVDVLAESIDASDEAPLRQQRQRLEAILAAAVEREQGEPRFPPSVPDGDLVNGLAQYLDLKTIERQALLECDGVLARCRALIDLLEMSLYVPRGVPHGAAAH